MLLYNKAAHKRGKQRRSESRGCCLPSGLWFCISVGQSKPTPGSPRPHVFLLCKQKPDESGLACGQSKPREGKHRSRCCRAGPLSRSSELCSARHRRRPFPPAATAKAGPRIPAAAGGTSGVRAAAGCPRPLRDAPGHRLGKSCTKPRWCPCRWGSQGSELSQSHPPSHTGARRCQRQGHPLWHHFTVKLVRQTSAGWRGGCCRQLRRARGGRRPPAPYSVGAEVGTTPMARCHLEGFAFARFGSRITEGTFTPLSLQLFAASEPGLGTGTFFHPAPSVSLGIGNRTCPTGCYVLDSLGQGNAIRPCPSPRSSAAAAEGHPAVCSSSVRC